MIQLYTLPPSGNSQKARMALRLLNLPYEEISLVDGGQKRPDYLALNPLGQVPLLVDGDAVVRDSGAILVYLAAAYRPGDWDGCDAAERGRIAQWLMLAAGDVANGLARLRLHKLFGAPLDEAAAALLGKRALSVTETQLGDGAWLEGGRLTIADLAMAPYVALAHQGGIDLTAYPNVSAWTARIAALPGFPSMNGWEAMA